jgi:hypothetical protein
MTHSGAMPDIHGNVVADRVFIGPEYIPRRSELAKTLIVAAGRTVELPEDSAYDYVEVAGTLKASRVHDTTLRFTHLVVLPNGTLDIGTNADPIPCDRKVELIIRDVPIDLAKDPFQWGNGLVNFGRQTRVGCTKTAWLEAADSIAAGARSITLASTPSGWQRSDELLIPDTRTPSPATRDPRREPPIAIASLNGAQLELSRPVSFEHQTITDPQGAVIVRPRIANLTRNIVIRSERPEGTPGHTADVGAAASWDIRYNLLTGLGRTRREPLDDTVPGGHIGANQRGKYAEHHHHVQSSPASADVGNVYIGHPNGKWGLVIHVTSDTLVEQNVAVDFPGAAFVTEDGYEARNVLRRNFAAYNLGRTVAPYGGFFDPAVNVTRNCPGCEGTGFWLRGVLNTLDGNEAWNNFTSGIDLFNQMQPDGKYPSVAGSKPDTALKHFADQPLSMTGNVVVANTGFGLELWGVRAFPNRQLISANNSFSQVFAANSDGVAIHLQAPKLICSVGTNTSGVHASSGYTGSLRIEDGGQIAGCAVGITGGGGKDGMSLTGTVLQNQVNVDLLPLRATFDSVVHEPLANYPHRYLLFGSGAVWNGTDPLPSPGGSYYIPQRGSRLVIRNWQKTGKDYRLFYRQSLAGNPAWYSAYGQHQWNTPVQGLTMQQSWDRFGLAFGGDVIKESEAVELDGLVNGLAREGLAVRYGPPRAVVTFPTMRENAVVEGNVVRIFALLTGDPDAASPVMMASVDGAKPVVYEMANTDDRSFQSTHVSPGIHEIKVWRTEKARPTAPIPGSEFTAQYCVGPCPSIPHGRISFSTSTLTFSAPSTGNGPGVQTITMSNSGAAMMNWVSRSSHQSCNIKPYSGRLEPGASTTLTISAGAPPGTERFGCQVSVLDSNADNSPQTITVNYVVSGQPNF